MNQEKSCGAVVFRQNAEDFSVLLLKHRGGHWDFPKGHVEAGESETQTALREVREESGLVVRIDPGLFRRKITYSPARNTVKDVVYFMAWYVSGELQAQASEISQAAFMSPQEALETISYPSSRCVLREALDLLDKGKSTGRQE